MIKLRRIDHVCLRVADVEEAASRWAVQFGLLDKGRSGGSALLDVTRCALDICLEPVAPGEQAVTVIADAKGGKATLEFEKKGDALVSKTKLPEGDGYNVVVQIKAKTDAKPQNFRLKYDTGTCGECKRAEYACTCGH